MNKEQYLKQRNILVKEAEGLIEKGQSNEADEKMNAIKALDEQFETATKAQANLAALKDTKFENPMEQEMDSKQLAVLGSTETTKTLENKVYETAFAKELLGQQLDKDERKIFNKVNGISNEFTHTTENTSVLIPETVTAGIYKLAEEAYPFFGDARKYNVRGKLTFKKHTAIKAGDAAWYEEPNKVEDEENTFGEMTLHGHEIAKAVTVSWKLKAMAIEEFLGFIQKEIADRIGVALGVAAVYGSGKKQPKGVVTELAESAKEQIISYDKDKLDYKKVTAAISKVHSSLLGGANIYANNSTIWNVLANLQDGNGRPYFVADVMNNGVGRIFGKVVKADAALKDGDILIGNPGQGMVFNTNEPLKIVTEDHAKARETDYVGYGVIDGAVLEPKAFVLLTNGEAPSPQPTPEKP
ncbi:phage major capsid protein, HK97 family [Enterococcus faecalis]|uniref:phage major capsid protein n=1 Tax=Enterococcus faecalis TaxID=1351 RepID=UPI00087FC3CD|nr:phage major capsid protein [Enterococcus faecalis]SDN92771.1 phage major capsid protein, HK97 family [Enterococcus faecalis]